MFSRLSLCFFFIGLTAYCQSMPVDSLCTPETRNLYTHLQQLVQKGILFGHQDDLAYGVGWRGVAGRSDVQSVTGQYPAVMGWDLGHIETGKTENLDSVPFQKIREYIRFAYKKGCINTVSWHLNNPYNGKSSWDETPTIKYILPGGESHATFKSWLVIIADFLKSLKTENGTPIPVIFRPYHEHTGSWFWWGKKESTPEEYIALWRFTERFLQEQGVHNVLYAYSSAEFSSKEDFLERYPGDTYIDIIGFDTYHRDAPKENANFVANTRRMLTDLTEIGKIHNKVCALTETGLESLTEKNWWTSIVYPMVKDYPLSYVLVWRNANTKHHYAPYPGHANAADFQTFSKMPKVLFEKKVAQEQVYKSGTGAKRK
ncbi:glycosyl hydrolase [Cytophagaceae bacterium DM2B3-1]|uniref:Mannan endo-1,4-beta-mannosidase n=1 Tax=Xanthocytophaga flava TaxID=3048013 RepID=A0ABT7D0A7_9BACT|nr:glycosyl hydrolase [Xanthocytophaga flavus]MDJ1498665.1 glycosyl hydrolase [Xanthocytophaga flavus]